MINEIDRIALVVCISLSSYFPVLILVSLLRKVMSVKLLYNADVKQRTFDICFLRYIPTPFLGHGEIRWKMRRRTTFQSSPRWLSRWEKRMEGEATTQGLAFSCEPRLRPGAGLACVLPPHDNTWSPMPITERWKGFGVKCGMVCNLD